MKKWLTVLLVLSLNGSNGFAAFNFVRAVTVDKNKVSSDQVNFPVLFSGTYNGGGGLDLRTVGNGGKVQNASGYDIGFYSNPNCISGKLNWETERYNASTGETQQWVLIGSLSSVTNTVYYVCYGDATIATDQSNKTAVWDSNYLGVWHLADGTTLSAAESTSHANNGTITAATAVAGQIDGGASFNGTSAEIVLTPGGGNFPTTYPMTFEMWGKNADNGATARNPLVYSASADNEKRIMIEWPFGVNGTNNVCWNVRNTAEVELCKDLAGDNLWHYAVGVSRSATDHEFYVDGISQGTDATNVAFPSMNSANIGHWVSPTNTFYNGLTDEVRVSDSSRTVGWILTQYNNQSSPSTFYSLGGEINLKGFLNQFRGMKFFGGRLR